MIFKLIKNILIVILLLVIYKSGESMFLKNKSKQASIENSWQQIKYDVQNLDNLLAKKTKEFETNMKKFL